MHEMRRAVAAIDAALADLAGMGDDAVAEVSIRLLSAEKDSLARRLALAAPAANDSSEAAAASEPTAEGSEEAAAPVDVAMEVSLAAAAAAAAAASEPPAVDEAEKPAELSVIELEVRL